MSRQSQTNTFNDGLNKDLNPLLTPNTVMTDCLNGTIVTYNGNEFALQNDLGNYKFKNGKLSDGYVPIGVKEHANTLYIVSYNPIEDKVEVGSFPSMKTITSSSISKSGKDFNIDYHKGLVFNYTDLETPGMKLLLEATENNKINPGDEYSLTGDEYSLTGDYCELWETLSYYIMTESNKIYDITNFIKYSDGEKFYYADWDVPGWLAVKKDVIILKEFNYSISKLEHSFTDGNISNIKFGIKIQSIWDNRYLTPSKIEYLKTYLSYLPKKIYPDLDSPDNEEYFNNEEISQSENVVISNNGLYTIISSYLTGFIDDDCNLLSITPSLGIYEGDYYMNYDNFTTTVNLEHQEWDPNSVVFGKDFFKYHVDDDKITLTYDIDKPLNANVTYQIKRLVDPRNTEGVNLDNFEDVEYPVFKEEQEITEVYNGQNILTIEFGDYGSVINGVSNPFDKEDKYIIEFYIRPDGGDGVTITKDLWVSEYINYYHNIYDNFDSDEFRLNEEAFVDAVKREFEVEDIFSTLPKDNIEVENIIRTNIGSSSEYMSLLDEYFNSIPKYSFNKSRYDKMEIKYGSRYNYFNSANPNINNIKIKFPKNQNGNVGRLWSQDNLMFDHNVYYTTNGNSEYFDAKQVYDDGTYSYGINVLNNIKINASISSINKNYPNDENIEVLYKNNDQITLEGDWFRLNYIWLIVQKQEKVHGDFEVWKCRFVERQDLSDAKILFKKSGDNELIIKLENFGNFIDDKWVKGSYEIILRRSINSWDIVSKKFNGSTSVRIDWFKHCLKLDQQIKTGASKISFSELFKWPSLVYILPYERDGYSDVAIHFYDDTDGKNQVGWMNCWLANNSAGDFNSWDDMSSSRLLSILIKNHSSKTISTFLPSKQMPWTGEVDDGFNYPSIIENFILNQICSLAYIFINLRGCKKDSNNTFYFPNFSYEKGILTNGVVIDNIKYNINITNYKYPTINSDKNLPEINTMLQYVHDIKKTLFPNVDFEQDMIGYLENLIYNKNYDINASYDNINSLNDIYKGDIFIDKNAVVDDYSRKLLLYFCDALKYDYNSKTITASDYELSDLNKISTHVGDVSYIYNDFYND